MMKWSNLWKLRGWSVWGYDAPAGLVTMGHDGSYLMHRNMKLPALVRELMELEYERGQKDQLEAIHKALHIDKVST